LKTAFRRIPFHLVVLGLLAGFAFGQQSEPANPYWYDIPSAPLKFDIPPRDLRYAEMQMLNIRSTGGVVRAYSLGCIRTRNDVASNTGTVRTWQLNQPPEKQFFPINILRTTAVPCEKRSEMLAVVRVEYADGGVWQIPEAQTEKAPRKK